MKALLYQGPGKLRLADLPTPEPKEGEALVAVEACGLCETDLAKIDAAFKEPPRLGHELAGRIVALGPGVKGFKKGDRVVSSHRAPCLECHYCLGGSEPMCREFKQSDLDPCGFAQFVRLSERHVRRTLLAVPKGLPFPQAAMTEPLARCLRNTRRLALRPGDSAAVVGLGFIGLLMGLLLRRDGVRVIGMDPDPARVRLAQKLGLEQAYTGKDGRMDQILASLSEARGVDALVLSAGTPELVSQRLSWIRDGGALNLFAGLHPASRASLDLDEFYRREIRVVPSRSSGVSDLREALRLIADGEIDVTPFCADTFPLDRYEEALRRVRGRETLKAILLPQKVAPRL